jgi:hypothetical protein
MRTLRPSSGSASDLGDLIPRHLRPCADKRTETGQSVIVKVITKGRAGRHADWWAPLPQLR